MEDLLFKLEDIKSSDDRNGELSDYVREFSIRVREVHKSLSIDSISIEIDMIYHINNLINHIIKEIT